MNFSSYTTNVKRLVNSHYGSRSGDLGLGRDLADCINLAGWYYCRDAFANAWNVARPKSDYFVLFNRGKKDDGGYGVALFIGRIESRLKLKHRSVFGPTDERKVMWIKCGKFWNGRTIRRSLFSALLRAGRKYDPKKRNFRAALYNAKYLKGTKVAVGRFLQGYTHFSRNSYNAGWHNTFSGLNKPRIEKMLSKPSKAN